MGLPDGDGVAILRAVRASGPKTRVIVCTGTAGPLRLMRLHDMGPDLTLIRPIEPVVICRLCEGWAA